MATKKTVRPETPNRGAADLRAHIVEHLKARIEIHRWYEKSYAESRMYALAHVYCARADEAEDNLKFVQTTDERASKREGGLGKR